MKSHLEHTEKKNHFFNNCNTLYLYQLAKTWYYKLGHPVHTGWWYKVVFFKDNPRILFHFSILHNTIYSLYSKLTAFNMNEIQKTMIAQVKIMILFHIHVYLESLCEMQMLKFCEKKIFFYIFTAAFSYKFIYSK